MRRFALKLLVLFAVVWGGWWYLATSSVHNRLNTWLEDRRAEGWQAEIASVTRAGFPLRITTILTDISLVDPQTQGSLRVPALTLSSPIYWPGHASVQLPADPLVFTAAEDTATLNWDGANAAVRLHPGTALQLETLSASSRNLSFELKDGQLISMANLQADVAQARAPETYEIDLTATGLSFGPAFTGVLVRPAGTPDAFEPIIADMTVTFDRPWDRSAMQGTRPQPRMIRINELAANYSHTGMTASGEMSVDAEGVPTGELRIKVRNWQEIFELMVASNTIPPEWAPVAERMLQSMSDLQGALDLTITAQSGQLRMGFLPLGPAPRLVIR